MLLAKKKDGSKRFDYRELNKMTVKISIRSLGLMTSAANCVGATVFSRLDLQSGYHQLSKIRYT